MTERRFVDLHTHSRCSDGSLSPEELIDRAEQAKLAAVALTDHDTTQGIAAARRQAQRYPALTFVPGIEISAVFPGGTLHILGLGVDETSASLANLTARLRQAREERNPKIIAKLQAVGVDVTMEDVLACVSEADDPARRVVGRLHIAEALRRKNVVRNVEEAMRKYLGDGRRAYVDKERTPPRDAIEAIRASGGAAVLAHPPQLRYENLAQLERIVRQFMDAGLEGIECYHSDHSLQQTRDFLNLARRLGLLVTGGSDYHGLGKPRTPIGRPRVPLSMIDLKRLTQGR